MKAVLSGAEFKRVAGAVRRFPSVGTFAGAGLVHFAAEAGKLTAGHVGIVVSRARVAAEGDLPLVGVDERNVDGFAPLCPDDAKVVLSLREGELTMRCKDREQKVAIAADLVPITLRAPKAGGMQLTEEIAPRVAYLSDIAHSDTSRAELCCVMMTAQGELMSCSQKIIAVMEGPALSQDVAVPLPLAAALTAGDVLYPGEEETIIRTDIATYSMRSPVKAQQEFPSVKIREFGKSERMKVGTCAGVELAKALQDCQYCIGKLAPTETVIDGVLSEEGLELTAVNGSTRFKAKVPLLSLKSSAGARFRAPMTEMCCAIPFLTTRATFSLAQDGALFLGVTGGWIWLPSFIEGKK